MPQSRAAGRTLTGLKDKKVTILFSKGEKTDGYMRVPPSNDLFGKPIWANYRSVSGNEYYLKGLVDYEVTAVFTVNYSKGSLKT